MSANSVCAKGHTSVDLATLVWPFLACGVPDMVVEVTLCLIWMGLLQHQRVRCAHFA